MSTKKKTLHWQIRDIKNPINHNLKIKFLEQKKLIVVFLILNTVVY